MAIFHCYVSSPEGTSVLCARGCWSTGCQADPRDPWVSWWNVPGMSETFRTANSEPRWRCCDACGSTNGRSTFLAKMTRNSDSFLGRPFEHQALIHMLQPCAIPMARSEWAGWPAADHANLTSTASSTASSAAGDGGTGGPGGTSGCARCHASPCPNPWAPAPTAPSTAKGRRYGFGTLENFSEKSKDLGT